jgi:hypothetical protein
MSASSTWHYRSVVAGAQRRSVSGRSAHSRPVLAMHKHTAWQPACSAVAGIANGVESS